MTHSPKEADQARFGERGGLRTTVASGIRASGMERLWSRAGATSGKHRQIDQPPEPLKQANSVAVGCDWLPPPATAASRRPSEYPDETTLLKANRSAGPAALAERTSGETAVADALRGAFAPYRTTSGAYRIQTE